MLIQECSASFGGPTDKMYIDGAERWFQSSVGVASYPSYLMILLETLNTILPKYSPSRRSLSACRSDEIGTSQPAAQDHM